jgi:MFS family permease
MVGGLLAAPLAGALVDRIGKHRAILAGALVADSLCFLALTLPIPFGVFMGIRFVEGCAHITALSVLLSLAAQALEPEHRGRAMGFVGGAMMLGIAIGAPIGGALGGGSPLVPLWAGSALLAVSAVAAAVGVGVRDTAAREHRPGLREIVATMRAHPEILAPLAFAFTDRFTVGFFTTTFALYLRRIYDVPAATIGLAIAAFMIPFALFSYPFGRIAERHSPVALLCVGSVLYGLGTACVGFTAPPALFLLMVAIGVTAAVMFVPSMLMTLEAVPNSVRATALGAFNAFGSLGFIAGPAAGGAITQLVAERADWLAGYRSAFVFAGASELLCVAIALPIFLARRSKRLAVRGDGISQPGEST